MGTYDVYIEAWRRRFSREAAQARTRAKAARRALGPAVTILKRHGATKIVLFGSLCSGALGPRSNIDLAVEGIDGRAFTRAFADLMMAVDWPVDLKPLEELDAPFRDAILAKGTILYETT
jgi:predicted nucleotidyltransferase